jgi:hypothetical protein
VKEAREEMVYACMHVYVWKMRRKGERKERYGRGGRKAASKGGRTKGRKERRSKVQEGRR